MNKSIMILMSCVSICIVVALVQHSRNKNGQHRPTIGIIQTASHPALDATREGFMAAVQEKIPNVSFIQVNGQGDIGTIHALAQRMSTRSNVDLFFAIATPAAQAIATLEKKKPIIIAAVTDPESLGLIHPSGNVTGCSDKINSAQTVALLSELAPNVRTIGILFSTAEHGSAQMAQSIAHSIRETGRTPQLIGVTNETEVATACTSAVRSIDALITPVDNMVATTISTIAQIMRQARKPLIVSDNLLVAQGALAARGVDYRKIGAQAGNQAVSILVAGKKPHELPLEHPKNTSAVINEQVRAELGL